MLNLPSFHSDLISAPPTARQPADASQNPDVMQLVQSDPSFSAARDLYNLMVRAEESACGVVEFGPGTPAAQAALVAVRAQYMEPEGTDCARLTTTGRQFLLFARDACGASGELDLVEILQHLLLTQEQIMVVDAVKVAQPAHRLHARLERIGRVLAMARWQYVPGRGFVRDADLACNEAAALGRNALH